MAEGPYADIQKYIEHLEQQTQEQAETIRNLNGTITDLRRTIANLQETLTGTSSTGRSSAHPAKKQDDFPMMKNPGTRSGQPEAMKSW